MGQLSIGVLEDDKDQSDLLELWLTDAGYDVSTSSDGADFVRAAQSYGFDLMLLDWSVPKMDGLEVLKWVRQNMREPVPVIFLTIRGEEQQIVAALEAGADDYVTKPASHKELLARITALARRSGLADREPDKLEVGEFELTRSIGQVKKNGEVIALTGKEFELAWNLFTNLSRILTREYLLRNVWNVASNIHTRTVDTHISRVRSKLGLRPEDGWTLSSVYHHGYRLEKLDS
jgi:DNA-binding response OmpR family regulator